MSKAQRIRELYAHGYSIKQVAEIVGCRDSYVRTCARQRVLEGGRSIADIRYELSDKGNATVDRVNARKRALLRAGDKAIAREAYAIVRLSGGCSRKAQSAYYKALYDSGREALLEAAE